MKSKIRWMLIPLIQLLVFSGCSSDYADMNDDNRKQEMRASAGNPLEGAKEGVIRVKFAPSIGDDFSVSMQGTRLMSSRSEVTDYLQHIKAVSMKRVFPHAGKFEKRTRKEGLHLWYDIEFDKSVSLTKASSEAASIPGVDIIEGIPSITVYSTKVYGSSPASTRSDMPFNDPGLPAQWHYNNTGVYPNSVAGADINLFPAWEMETGKPSVIVSIVDGGVDYMHEDLNQNMYVNLAELNGTPGEDSDGNGYIDDVYGYNFVTDKGKLTSDNHGTHVAGTVAARNNNNIGVAGVAGGNGTPESGIRLMSCQIFERNNTGNSSAAIKYGADNGAVISQNSWGYNLPMDILTSHKAAIDYFIKYAGCDNDGNQLPDSPMKGGVVIFAAGNDSWDVPSYPAAYPPVISVSAMAPDFKKTWYTNRGKWISIMAPGGDEYYSSGMVYSTLPDNEYGYMQGTSMACPHVSGVAALVVSKFGGPGFTNEELKTRILGAIKQEDIDEYNPNYKGRLGRGYIDATLALATNGNKPPAPLGQVTVKTDYVVIELSWKAVADEDDGTASIYNIYYTDKEKLNESNYSRYEPVQAKGHIYNPGDMVKYTLSELATDTEYHFAIVAKDRWGLATPPVFFSGKTKKNNPPQLTVEQPETIRVCATEEHTVKISVNEPDGHNWTYQLTGEQRGVSHKRVGDDIMVTIKAVAPLGKYTFTVSVSDIYQFTTTKDVAFEVYGNSSPKLVKEFSKLYVPITKTDYSIKLSDYFTDPDGHDITYTVQALNPSTAGTKLSGNVLTIVPAAIGMASVKVTATDIYKAKTTATINLQVVKGDLVYLVYPIPVTSVLNVRLSEEVQHATLTIRGATGDKVLEQSVTPTTDESRLVQLDLSKLAGGTYTLYVASGDKTFQQLFVKH